MTSESSSANNESHNSPLIITLHSHHNVVLQPEGHPIGDSAQATQLLIFPERLNQQEDSIKSAGEWASASRGPVYILEEDLPFFMQQGFGSYRFNLIGDYKELGFANGSLCFFPAKRRRPGGLGGILVDVKDAVGLAKPSAYHVLLRMRSPEKIKILYLASPFLDRGDWKVLQSQEPQVLVGSQRYDAQLWHTLAERLNTKIYTAAEFMKDPTWLKKSELQIAPLSR